MNKLVCIILVLVSLIAAVPTQAQRGHAFRGHAYPYRYPRPYYRQYRFWGYPFGFWGYPGLGVSDLYPYYYPYPYPAYDAPSPPPSPPRPHQQAKFLTPPLSDKHPLPKAM